MKKDHIFSFLLLLLILMPSVSFSTVYKWTDENGKIWITDYNGPLSDEKETEEKAVTPAAEIKQNQPAQKSEPAKAQTDLKQAPKSTDLKQAATVKPAEVKPAPMPKAADLKPVAPVKTTPVDSRQVANAKTAPATTPMPPVKILQKDGGPASHAPIPAPVQQTESPKPLPPFDFPKEMPKYPGLNKNIPTLPAYATALMAGGFAGLFLMIYLVFYIYCALCLYLIAKKLDVGMAWLSWIPILQVWPFLRSAGKPCWWVLTFFIPFFNIFFLINVCMCMTENLGRNKWLGLLFLVPVINMVFLGVLAFSRNESYSPGLSAA